MKVWLANRVLEQARSYYKKNDAYGFIDLYKSYAGEPECKVVLDPYVKLWAEKHAKAGMMRELFELQRIVANYPADVAVLKKVTQESIQTLMAQNRLKDFLVLRQFVARNREGLAAFDSACENAGYTVMTIPGKDMKHGYDLSLAFRHQVEEGQDPVICRAGCRGDGIAWSAQRLVTHWQNHKENRSLPLAALQGTIETMAQQDGPAAGAARMALATMQPVVA